MLQEAKADSTSINSMDIDSVTSAHFI